MPWRRAGWLQLPLLPWDRHKIFFYNKSCFRNSLPSMVLVCAFKPLGRGVRVGIIYFSPPPVPTMSVGLVKDCVT